MQGSESEVGFVLGSIEVKKDLISYLSVGFQQVYKSSFRLLILAVKGDQLP